MSLLGYIVRRLAMTAIIMVVIAAINFLLFQVLPFTLLGINPEIWYVPALGTSHNLQYITEIREKVISELGFNLPLQYRFLRYMESMFTFHFGYNVGGVLSGPVSATIERFAPYTILLLGGSTVASFIVGEYLGVFSASRRGRPADKVSFITLLFLYSMPSFWIGVLLLLIFAYYGRFAPTSAAAYISQFTGPAFYLAVLKAMALPFLSLTLISIGGFYLIMRSSTLEVMNEDYVLMARAKGLRERDVLYRHVLRNAVIPVMTVFAISMGFVLSGAVITETIFGWPGLGYWTYMAIITQDFPLEQAIFFIISLMVVLANLVADLLYGFLDPRIRR
ncbi:MAG: ABC transporter permease [Conexivisphaera sp.]